MITFDQSYVYVECHYQCFYMHVSVYVCEEEMKNRGRKLQLIIYIYKIHIHYIFLSNLHYLLARAKTIRVARERERERRMKNEISIHMCGRRVVIREQEYIRGSLSVEQFRRFIPNKWLSGRFKYAKYIEHANELVRTVGHN